ncbi:MAG: STAS domain-containing protein [Bryobacterales bacterium]|nr:STAS domain-containing protein [Bryobacterales bacterium]
MSLEIHTREREGVVLADLKGRITAGEEASRLRELLRGLVAGGGRNVVLNLAEVDYIDSTGLGALVMCHNSTAKAGGTLKLVNLNQRTIELLVMTKLAVVFETFDDEQDAVNSFFPEREIRRFDILDFVRRQED